MFNLNPMTKEEIRRLYREKRTQLSNEELQKRQNDLEYQYTLFDLSPYQTVHVFLSIQKHNEPNTQPLIDLLFSQEKTVVVSKTDFATKHMTHWVITPKTPREVTSFGISEPMGGTQLSPEKLDLVFVPLLSYDKNGQRVGYGQGFYDRFLAACRSKTKFVGLSLFPVGPSIEDSEPTDIRLHACIGPNHIEQF